LLVLGGARAAGGAAEPASFVVALDPGHGGSNLGAHGPAARLYEKDVTLELAVRVQALVAHEEGEAHPIRVVLCRDKDVLVPIRARARCAADHDARLFLSLHTNAVPAHKTPGSARGFDVFVLDPPTVAEDAALAADAATTPLQKAVSAHRTWALARAARVAAEVVRRHLSEVLGANADRGLREGGALLDVLRGAAAPAVLVEVGFLDHPEEGIRLGTAEGREPVARALAAAIRDLARAQAGAI